MGYKTGPCREIRTPDLMLPKHLRYQATPYTVITGAPWVNRTPEFGLQNRRFTTRTNRAYNFKTGCGKQESNLISLAYETNVETVSPSRNKSGGEYRI